MFYQTLNMVESCYLKMTFFSTDVRTVYFLLILRVQESLTPFNEH